MGVPSTPRELPDGNTDEIKVSPGAGWRKRRIMCHVLKIRFILYLIVLEGILSSSTNFLIYCFIGHNFRKEFLLLLGLRRKMVRNFSRAILIKSFFTKGGKLLGMFSVLLYDVRFYQFPVRVPSLQKTIADCSGCERASLAITVGHHGHCHHHYHHHHHHPRTVFIDIQ